MFVHDINPIIFSIGPLAVRWYGLAYVIGFLFAYYWMKRAVRLKHIKKLNEQLLDTLIVYLIIGVIAGGRILQFVFFRPAELLNNPLEILFVWHGGMSFHGGLIGAGLAMYLFSRKYKVSLAELADQLAIPAAFALGLGRIANFINGEMVGTITSVPWCVQFPIAEGCRHPVVLYESIKTFAVGGILLWARPRMRRKGHLFWLFVTLYGFLRFAINFWRDEALVIFGWISMGQLLSLLMGCVGLYFLTKHIYTNKAHK